MDVPAVMAVLAAPPQVHTARGARDGDPVGVDQRAVHDHVRVTGRLGGQQHPVQGRPASHKHRDAFVAVVIRGGHGDGVVPCQGRHPGVLEEPAQHQHGLFVGAQCAGSLAGTPAPTFAVQQGRQEQHAVLGYLQNSGVCDAHPAQNPP